MVQSLHMDTPQTNHHARLAVGVFGTALIAAVGFHFLFYRYQYGAAFSLFIILLVIGVLELTDLSKKRGNSWAYLFLIPVLCGITAEALYASQVVRSVGFILTVGSLAMFTYWFTSPQVHLRNVTSLFPIALFTESFFPFTRLKEAFAMLSRGKSHVKRVVIGTLLAVPFLFIIGSLFVSADAYLRQTVEGLFAGINVPQLINRTVWDYFAFLFFLSAGWMLLSRLLEGRKPREVERRTLFDHVVTGTFLTLLNLLFLAFLGFLLLHLFGGEAAIQLKGITYASYAREGFFQLMTVAVIVFGILAGVYRFADMKHWAVRGLSIALIVQTAVVNISAIRRLLLYISTYNLTLSRVWAMIVIILVSVLLAIVLAGIASNATFAKISKIGFFTVLFSVSLILCWNTERSVASYNVNRFLSGATDQFDSSYLLHLSSDAVPEIVRLSNSTWPADQSKGSSGYNESQQRDLKETLKIKRTWLQVRRDTDWRLLVLSDYIALSVLPTE
jgi:hypothetical protein